MNKIFLTSILSVAALTASAQSAYDAGNIVQTDLSGSARYVGMGGALNALGADISLMGSNPAGVGLFRRSDVNFALSTYVTGDEGQRGNDKSKVVFDQAGAVFALPVDNSGSGLQYVNLGVNYRRKKNFFGNNAVHVGNLNGVFSQTTQIADLANDCAEFCKGNWGVLADMSAPYTDPKDHKNDHDGIIMQDEQGYFGIPGKDANYSRHTYGAISEFDVNMAFNVSNRFYYGLTVGIYDVNYGRESYYEELGVDNNYFDFTNWYRTTGTGVDLKFGFVCRPIEDSAFRFGVAVHTPTWYRLTDASGSVLYLNDNFVSDGGSDDYEYKLRSPWVFNLSLGHTIGSKLAIGAEYEYTDFSKAKYSAIEYRDIDYMLAKNEQCIKTTLKGQHTIKIGAEYRPIQALSLRLGYNYLSSAYDKAGFKTILYDEPFTETDFTNWGGINRITCGIGYNWRNGYIDAAYQYQVQKGDFYAFDDVDLKPTTINGNRSQIMATLGFRF